MTMASITNRPRYISCLGCNKIHGIMIEGDSVFVSSLRIHAKAQKEQPFLVSLLVYVDGRDYKMVYKNINAV